MATPGRVTPDLVREAELLVGRRLLVGLDEVGRGAIAGPVSVGAVLVDAAVGRAPEGLADSKMLSPARREALVGPICDWARGWSVGHASAAEIDEHGILAALRLAGERALAALPVAPQIVLLDGGYDWLRRPPATRSRPPLPAVEVVTEVRADASCASVAAASVLAKVTRDALMVDLGARHDAFGFEWHKGYGTPRHLDALQRFGPCEEHRRSWRLPDQLSEHD